MPASEVESHPSNVPKVPLPKTQFILVFFSLGLAILLFAVDQTIVATSLPTIVTEFQAADLISWVGTGYLLTAAAFSPIYGKLADVFGRKWVFLFAIFIFELGSLICGASSSMEMLIAGRVIAGIGGGGLFNLILIIISDIVSLQDRGKYQGIIGAVFGFSSVLGPLAGGAFTDSPATWRWSFYINLPIGGFTILVIFFFLSFPKNDDPDKSIRDRILSIDYIGVIILISAITAFMLPTQLGGTTWAWNAPQTIALFILSAVLFLAFWFVEKYVAKEPVVPPSMFINVSVYFSIILGLFLGGAFFAVSYYVPLYFQVVNGDSATMSGVKTIPMIAGLVALNITSGQIISRTNVLVPFFYVSGVLLTVGFSLLSTMDESTEYWKIALMLLITGIGAGCAAQARILAVQSIVAPQMIAVGTSLSGFFQILGGSIGIAVFGVVFSNKITSELISTLPSAYSTPEFVTLLSNSPNSVRAILAALPNNGFQTVFPIYLRAFISAMRVSFYSAIPFGAMILICALFMRIPRRQLVPQSSSDLEAGNGKDELLVEDESNRVGEETSVEEEPMTATQRV